MEQLPLSDAFLAKQSDLIRQYSVPLTPQRPSAEKWSSILKVTRSLSLEAGPLEAPRPSIKALLFDVYGTLFQSASGDIGTVQKDSETPQSLPLPPLFQRIKSAEQALPDWEPLFLRRVEAFHHEKKEEGLAYPEINSLELWKQILAPWNPSWEETAEVLLWFEMSRNPVWPMPGAADLLNDLKTRKIPLGIVSNAQYYTLLLFPALLDAPLEDCGFHRKNLLSWSFEAGRSKPDVTLFEKPLEALKAGIHENRKTILPEATLYIGNDRRNDVYTAQKAGCQTLLFAGDLRSLRLRPEDAIAGDTQPDYITRNLLDTTLLLREAP